MADFSSELSQAGEEEASTAEVEEEWPQEQEIPVQSHLHSTGVAEQDNGDEEVEEDSALESKEKDSFVAPDGQDEEEIDIGIVIAVEPGYDEGKTKDAKLPRQRLVEEEYDPLDPVFDRFSGEMPEDEERL